MSTLREIEEDLKLLLDDFRDLLEIADSLSKGHIYKAKDKIRDLDTCIRDYCVKYFNEDMLNRIGMETIGGGKITGKKHTNKEFVEAVAKGTAFYLIEDFQYYITELRKILNAKKTNDTRKKLS